MDIWKKYGGRRMIEVVYTLTGILLVAQVAAVFKIADEVRKIGNRKEKEWNE